MNLFKKPLLFVVIAISLLFSCEMRDPSKYRVFKDNRKWIYDVYFLNEKKDTTDNITLVLATIDKFYPSFEQRSISWEYFDSSLNKTVYDYSGVRDKPGNIWMHPPRSGKFHILSFAPFPDYNDNCKNAESLESEGIMGMHKTYKGITVNKVKDFQSCKGEKEILLPSGLKIKANFKESYSESNLGKIIHNYYMNDSFGLIKSHYVLHDTTEIIMELKIVEGY